MGCFWSILVGLALLTAGSLPDSAEASDQRSPAWKKSTNFNNHPPRKAVVNITKRGPKVEIAQSHRAGK
jgi:hypothetical protein